MNRPRCLLALVLLIGAAMAATGARGAGAGGPPGDDPITQEERRSIGEFFQRHGQLLAKGSWPQLMALYDDSFFSETFRICANRALLESTYRKAIGEAPKAEFHPFVSRIEKLDNRFAVSVCEVFSPGPNLPVEDWCQLFVLERRGAEWSILRLYDIDHGKASHLSNQQNQYENKELRFRFTRPPGFFLVHQGTSPGFLDNFRLIDDTLRAEIQVSVFPMILIGDRDQLIARDAKQLAKATDDFESAQPVAFTTAQRLEGTLVQSSFVISETSPLATHIPTPGEYDHARCYLSPDQRILFSVTFQAPPEEFESLQPGFLEFVRSLELTDVQPTRYWEQVCAAHGWGKMEDARQLHHPKLLSFTAPPDWRSEILPTSDCLSCLLKRSRLPSPGYMELGVTDLRDADDTSIGVLIDHLLAKYEGDANDRTVMQRQDRDVAGCAAVDLTARCLDTGACLRTVYFRTADKLFAATLTAGSVAEAKKLGADFERWIGSFQLPEKK